MSQIPGEKPCLHCGSMKHGTSVHNEYLVSQGAKVTKPSPANQQPHYIANKIAKLQAQVEALQRENADLHNQLIEVTDHRCTLVRENERLKAALKNYADPDPWNWDGDGYSWNGSMLDYRVPPHEIASQALASRATQPAPQEGK